MGKESKCELVEFKIDSARFINIDPRPRKDSPQDLEQTLLELVKQELESVSHSCGDGCDCVVGEPVAVASREQIKKVSDGTYTAWYQVVLTKYRTEGECMPAEDDAPD